MDGGHVVHVMQVVSEHQTCTAVSMAIASSGDGRCSVPKPSSRVRKSTCIGQMIVISSMLCCSSNSRDMQVAVQ